MKAFDLLWNVDPHTDYWYGKRGAISGLLKHKMETQETSQETQETSHVQVDLEELKLLLQHHTTPDAIELLELINIY